ncbi:MAG: tRNA (adenosine(37)-N6)-dimethylallyltransferase MiaA [Candidatus Aminicenantes bacterium]|nr:tRNA (adenosine(37)-N6)-dimethylallyltransferase MiaA [Candidatus Aminicenantes bacterium]
MRFKQKSLVIILGPTAVGKSAVAVQVAKKFKGEVINCDSMQVYKGFDIGTDKISPEKMEGIAHHLLDFVDPSYQFTAADFIRHTLAALEDIHSRKKLPVITGGTGLYLKTLLEGLFPDGGKDSRIRKILEDETEKKGLEYQWKILLDIDPIYAEKIGPNDRIRIVRALEVFYATNKTLTEHFAGTEPFLKDFFIVKIGLKMERPLLYTRIEARVDKMFEKGIVQETKALLKSGIEAGAPPFRALGYKHVLAFLQHKITLDEAVCMTKIDTRHYAKRQMTWFRKMNGIMWFPAEKKEDILSCLEEILIK